MSSCLYHQNYQRCQQENQIEDYKDSRVNLKMNNLKPNSMPVCQDRIINSNLKSYQRAKRCVSFMQQQKNEIKYVREFNQDQPISKMRINSRKSSPKKLTISEMVKNHLKKRGKSAIRTLAHPSDLAQMDESYPSFLMNNKKKQLGIQYNMEQIPRKLSSMLTNQNFSLDKRNTVTTTYSNNRYQSNERIDLEDNTPSNQDSQLDYQNQYFEIEAPKTPVLIQQKEKLIRFPYFNNDSFSLINGIRETKKEQELREKTQQFQQKSGFKNI
ncbi:UNKNOWN [Stylonychia lemnae]|uniref:Uncharacterized protein n=1 Tax=Stylonychia lemnae TaxID=5949 RepID=A0A078B6U6_STYLE|nr:UNKNOWN [Stylonychia lemnae]|eukprot:CDW90109.1 UNKNOWN [Stylonychia lemnae]